MRVLELYSGYESLQSVFIGCDFDVVSSSLESFDINSYPIESNCFNIVFININDNSLGFRAGLDDDCLMVGMDCVEYYNPKYWIILHNGVNIQDDVIMWGLPFRVVKSLRGGKQTIIRVWNNIFKWKPRNTYIYYRKLYY